LRVRTEDLAKFGQLYLQKGRYGRQLLPPEWVEAASARQVSNGSNPKSDWNQGYGFQFWRCRNNAFRGDGAFGQFCVVMPDQDAVIAITSGIRDMQSVLDLVWDKFLPACQPESLPSNPSWRARLTETLSGLQLAPARGADTSDLAENFLNRKFIFAVNDQKLESVSLNSADSATTLTLRSSSTKGKSLQRLTTLQSARAPFSAGHLPNSLTNRCQHLRGTETTRPSQSCAYKLR